VAQANNPVFIEGLKLLAQADLSLDTANPQPDLLEAVVRVSDKVPELRVIIDHLPAMKERADVVLRELAKRPRIYVKVSELLRLDSSGKAVLDPATYKPGLDYLFETFGEDRLIFGSDWPNGPAVDNLPAIVKIVKDYFNTKGQPAAEKYFNRNSAVAYKWVRRQA
jgi:predicted TIM-barrel fold metal-dependent hydrolase